MAKKLFWLKMLIYFLNFITLELVPLGKLISEKIEILKKQVEELESK
ncbi:hypothetical protein [Spiroplasma endosymbiont of Clivina fossor]